MSQTPQMQEGCCKVLVSSQRTELADMRRGPNEKINGQIKTREKYNLLKESPRMS